MIKKFLKNKEKIWEEIWKIPDLLQTPSEGRDGAVDSKMDPPDFDPYTTATNPSMTTPPQQQFVDGYAILNGIQLKVG